MHLLVRALQRKPVLGPCANRFCVDCYNGFLQCVHLVTYAQQMQRGKDELLGRPAPSGSRAAGAGAADPFVDVCPPLSFGSITAVLEGPLLALPK